MVASGRARIIKRLVHHYAQAYGRYNWVEASVKTIGQYKFETKHLGWGVANVIDDEIWDACQELDLEDVDYRVFVTHYEVKMKTGYIAEDG